MLDNIEVGVCEDVPGGKLVDESANTTSVSVACIDSIFKGQRICNLQRTNFRTDKWTRGIKHHRKSKFLTIEHVADSTAGNTQKGSTRQAIEKSTDEHRLNVLGHGTWNEPDEEERE